MQICGVSGHSWPLAPKQRQISRPKNQRRQTSLLRRI